MKFGAVVIPTSRELGKISARDRGMFPVQFEGYLTHPKDRNQLAMRRVSFQLEKTTKGGCQCLSGTPDMFARHIVVIFSLLIKIS